MTFHFQIFPNILFFNVSLGLSNKMHDIKQKYSGLN